MSRVLLADDSPHAQRMGERILRDEGHEVVTITDGETVLVRLADVDPDVLILDAQLPLRSGFEIARFVKDSQYYAHAAVLLTGSPADPVDEAQARESGADAVVMKPFEPEALNKALAPLLSAKAGRRDHRQGAPPAAPAAQRKDPAPRLAPLPVRSTPEIEPDRAAKSALVPPAATVTEKERVRAAVTLAVEQATPTLIDDLTTMVLKALHEKGK